MSGIADMGEEENPGSSLDRSLVRSRTGVYSGPDRLQFISPCSVSMNPLQELSLLVIIFETTKVNRFIIASDDRQKIGQKSILIFHLCVFRRKTIQV